MFNCISPFPVGFCVGCFGFFFLFFVFVMNWCYILPCSAPWNAQFPSQVGKLHRCLVKPDTLELTEQCKEETGLTVEELVKAEPLDKVLQQVSPHGHVVWNWTLRLLRRAGVQSSVSTPEKYERGRKNYTAHSPQGPSSLGYLKAPTGIKMEWKIHMFSLGYSH